MPARALTLNEKAAMRLIEASQAQGLSPDAYVLKFVPAVPKAKKPKKAVSKQGVSSSTYLKRVEAGVKALRKDPKAQAEAEKRFFSRRPIIADEEEAGRIADGAVRKYRSSQRAKKAKR